MLVLGTILRPNVSFDVVGRDDLGTFLDHLAFDVPPSHLELSNNGWQSIEEPYLQKAVRGSHALRASIVSKYIEQIIRLVSTYFPHCCWPSSFAGYMYIYLSIFVCKVDSLHKEALGSQ